MDRAAVEALPLLPHEETDWARVSRTTYAVRQHFRYRYAAPIRHLRQRLMLVPPLHHGDQKRLGWGVEVSCPAVRSHFRDRYGNVVIDLEVDQIASSIDFDAWTVVERRSDAGPHRVKASRAWATASALTEADHVLAEVAGDL